MHRLLMMFTVVALLAGTRPASAQESAAENPSRDQAQEQMEIWRSLREADFTKRALSAAHFRVGDDQRAELVLISTLADPVQIEIEAYSSAGERFPLGHHTVESSQPLHLDVGELIATSAAAAPVRGSLRLFFIGDEKALAGWLVQHEGSQVLELPLQISRSDPGNWRSFIDLPRLRPHADSFAYVVANHGAASAG